LNAVRLSIAAAIAALALPAAATGAGRPSPLLSFVGYTSDLADSPAAVYTVRADGRGLRKLFEIGRGHDLPVWSPDGRRLAEATTAGLRLVDASDKPLRTLTASASDHDPDWSPDGRWIAFRRSLGGRSYLLAVRADGTGLHQVTHALRQVDGFEWAPDSQRVLVQWSYAGEPRFGVVGASGALRVLQAANCPSGPTWSPDGRSVAFAAGCRGGSRIGVKDLATGRVRWLTRSNETYYDGDPAWSPDGRRLAFSRFLLQGSYEPALLMTVGRDGSALRALEDLGASSSYDEVPQWSPDGRFILFDRDSAVEPNGEYVQVAVLNVATLDVRVLFEPMVRRTQTWLPG
jgi:Tol biopolymer transport system component